MEESTLTFARPLWLYAAPVVCAVAAWLLARFDRRREADLAKLVHPRFRTRLIPGFSPRLRLLKRSLWLGALLLLFIAAAGPRHGFEFREVKRRGIDLLFAVDTSRSMLAEDFSPNRLERARLGIHDFINRLRGDRVGLIPFAGSAFALCPLTSDYDAFRESLDALDTDLIPRQGTDVASAIHEAARLFDEQQNNHRILILITDGEDLQGDALEAAREHAKKGMVIYPLGVGSAAGENIPVRMDNGYVDLLRDAEGQPVTTKLDESTLKKIAEATGGLYVPMGRGAEGLETIHREKLRLVPPEESESRLEKIPLERYEWPLALALIFLIMELLLPDRQRPSRQVPLPSAARRRFIPRRAKSAVSAAIVVAGLGMVFGTPASHAADARVLYNQGTTAYAAGDFKSAAESLKSALHTTDLQLQNRAYYNLGNALYRSGEESLTTEPKATIESWEAAIKAWDDALALNPGDADARFNRDFVRKKLDELKQQQPEDQQDKKDGEKQDGEKEEKEKQDGDKKEGDQQEGDQSSEGEKSDEDGKDPSSGEKQGEDGKPEDGKEGSSGEESADSEKKGAGQGEEKDGDGKQSEEEGKEANGEEKSAGKEKETSSTAERKAAQARQMSPDEARQLLQMMRGEQRTVIPLEPQPRRRYTDPNNSTKGKTW